jgi:GGDEF domain-containing protein
LLFIGVDGFKKVNDSWGTPWDQALKIVGHA